MMSGRSSGAGNGDGEYKEVLQDKLSYNHSSSCNTNLRKIGPPASSEHQNEDGAGCRHRLSKRRKIEDLSSNASGNNSTPPIKTPQEAPNDAALTPSYNEDKKSSSNSWKNDNMTSSSTKNFNEDDDRGAGDVLHQHQNQEGPTMFSSTSSSTRRAPPFWTKKKGGMTRSNRGLPVASSSLSSSRGATGTIGTAVEASSGHSRTVGIMVRPSIAYINKTSGAATKKPAGGAAQEETPLQHEKGLSSVVYSTSSTANATSTGGPTAALPEQATTTTSKTCRRTSSSVGGTPREEKAPTRKEGCCSSRSENEEGHSFANPTKSGRSLITKPGPNDILMGRGRPFQNYIGNRKMVAIVDKRKDAYNATPRQERRPVGEAILDEVLQTGARFLRKVEIPPSPKEHDKESSQSKLLVDSTASPPPVAASHDVDFVAASSLLVGASTNDDAGTIPCGPWEEVPRQVAFDKVTHVIRGKRRIRKTTMKNNKKEEANIILGDLMSNRRGETIVGNSVREKSLGQHGYASGSYNSSSQEASTTGFGASTMASSVATFVAGAAAFDGGFQRNGRGYGNISGPGGSSETAAEEGPRISPVSSTGEAERGDIPVVAGQEQDVAALERFILNTISWSLGETAAEEGPRISPVSSTGEAERGDIPVVAGQEQDVAALERFILNTISWSLGVALNKQEAREGDDRCATGDTTNGSVLGVQEGGGGDLPPQHSVKGFAVNSAAQLAGSRSNTGGLLDEIVTAAVLRRCGLHEATGESWQQTTPTAARQQREETPRGRQQRRVEDEGGRELLQISPPFGDNTTNHKSNWSLVAEAAEARASSSSLSPQDAAAAVQDLMRALLTSNRLPGPQESSQLLTLLKHLLVTAQGGRKQAGISTQQNQPKQNDHDLSSLQNAPETRGRPRSGGSGLAVATSSMNEARVCSSSSTPAAAAAGTSSQEHNSKNTRHDQSTRRLAQEEAQASELLLLLSSLGQYHRENEILLDHHVPYDQQGYLVSQQPSLDFSSTDSNRWSSLLGTAAATSSRTNTTLGERSPLSLSAGSPPPGTTVGIPSFFPASKQRKATQTILQIIMDLPTTLRAFPRNKHDDVFQEVVHALSPPPPPLARHSGPPRPPRLHNSLSATSNYYAQPTVTTATTFTRTTTTHHPPPQHQEQLDPAQSHLPQQALLVYLLQQEAALNNNKNNNNDGGSS